MHQPLKTTATSLPAGTAFSFVVSVEETRRFAQLSGDFNPSHVDPNAARRSLTGETVVHGVHALLRALDGVLADRPGDYCIEGLTATFARPILHGREVTCTVNPDQRGGLHLELRASDQNLQVILLRLATSRAPCAKLPPPELAHGSGDCRELTFAEAERARGDVPLALERSLCGQLFPNAARALPLVQLAELLAATRIVGMECPGRHSMLTKIAVQATSVKRGDLTLAYCVPRSHRPFSLLTLAVTGPTLAGELQVLYPPPAVAQAEYHQVQKAIPSGEFVSRRALVVGGSRGLGEVTAKILAAGGAKVIITYRRGSADAARIREEIARGGGRCQAMAFDVLEPPDRLPAGFSAHEKPTHLFGFASPAIGGKTTCWDFDRFASFARYYVQGFLETVRATRRLWQMDGERLEVFYPSTVLLDTGGLIAAEYAAAKAAGEALCRHLPHELPGTVCQAVRLPRLRTDQTNSFAVAAAPDALPVMRRVLRQFLSGAADGEPPCNRTLQTGGASSPSRADGR